MARDLVPGTDFRADVVECPRCGRRIAVPTDCLIVYGTANRVTAESAGAVECPACSGVTFVEDRTSDFDH